MAPPPVALLYSLNQVDWYPFLPGGYGIGTTIILRNQGNSVWFKAASTNLRFGTSDNAETNFNHFSFSGTVSASGNIMSLLNGNKSSTVLPATSTFFGLFHSCASLISAPELPAVDLKDYCYMYMFCNCTALRKAPDLPASIVPLKGYDRMFKGCSALTGNIVLPATSAASYCYERMFDHTQVTSAKIEAVNTPPNMLWGMFDGASKLDAVSVKFTKWPSGTSGFLNGVSKTGTFTCPVALGTNETIKRGSDFVPTGWTVVNY